MAKNSAKQQTVVAKGPPPLKQTMAKPIAGYTDPNDLRTLMTNAKRLGRDDIWREAFQRLAGCGLVEMLPQRGARVSQVSADEIVKYLGFPRERLHVVLLAAEHPATVAARSV